jgi:hypothetical protein
MILDVFSAAITAWIDVGVRERLGSPDLFGTCPSCPIDRTNRYRVPWRAVAL